tara:strand:- start:1917 stop:2426 length:510 start_codon:yes stop_codon:yes gene_type:complete
MPSGTTYGQPGWNKQELADVQRALKKLSPKDDKNLERIARMALKKAAKPMVNQLRNEIKNSKLDDTGQMRKSIAAIPVKKKGIAVYVGPRVKGAYKSEDKSGFYFYFLEHGFTLGRTAKGKKRKKGEKFQAENMLDNLVGSEDAVYQNFKKELETIIMKRCLKNGFNFG